MTDTVAAAATSPFADLLRELYHGRSWVAGPAVSPDGQRIAFVVATIDLDENTTTSRVWLTGAGRRAGAGHGRAQRRPTGLVAGRALPRLHVQARREGEGGDAARDAGRRPRRGAHAGLDARGLHPADVVARRQADRLHQPHPRQALRRQGRELAAAAQDRDVLHAAQRRGLDRRPAGRTCTSSTPTAPARRATSPPARTTTAASPGSPTPRRSSPAPAATTAGTSTSPPTSTSCRSTARSGPSPTRPATTRTRPCPPTAHVSPCSGWTTRRSTRRTRRSGSSASTAARSRGSPRRSIATGSPTRLPASRCGPTTTRCSPPSRIAARPTSTSWRPTGRGRRRRSPRARSPCKASTPPAARWRWPRRRCSAPPSCSRSTARSRR